MAVQPATILDAHGRAARYGGSMFTPPRSRSKTSKEVREAPRMDRDYWSLISAPVHRQMLSDSRQIARMPLVRGALKQKSDYVCGGGLRPYYAGRNSSFGDKAEAWLEQWFKICNVRGPNYHWDKGWAIGCRAIDVDAGFFILLTESATGWPRLQTFDAHQVHSRPGQSVVKSGPFAGRPIVNGIVYDDQADEIGYQVLGPTEADDVVFSSDDMIHVADPDWFTEGRGLSPVSYGLHEWYAYRDCQDNELLAQTITSSLVLLEKNEAGMNPDLSRELGKREGIEPEVSELDGGLMKYIKNADSLEAFLSNRPAPEVAAFWKAVSAAAIFAMEWRREMFDFTDAGGGAIKAFADAINTVIHGRHAVLARVASRIVAWAIAKAIKRGDLPKDPDWWMWDFPLPPNFTPDAGRSIQAVEAALRMGIDCEDDVVQATKGTTYKRMMRRRAHSIVTKIQTAKEFGIDPRLLGHLDRPGDLPAAAAAAPAAESVDTEDADAQAAAQAGEIQSTALNGAQVQALVDLALKVASGELPIETARAIARSSFPLVPDEEIDAIFDSLAGFKPAQPAA